MKPYMRPIWAGAQVAGPAVDRPRATGRQLDDPRRGRAMPERATFWWSAAPADNTDGMFGELLATALRARGVWAGDRRWLSGRTSYLRNAIPGLVEGNFGEGHREGDAWRGERSGRLRGRECRTGRRDRRRRRRVSW